MGFTIHCALATGGTPSPAVDRAHAIANATNRFTITGMHCDGCAQGIASELNRVPGVVSVGISFSNQLGVVVYDTNHTSTAKLIRVIRDAGFKARKSSP